jgi:hypothetical protein
MGVGDHTPGDDMGILDKAKAALEGAGEKAKVAFDGAKDKAADLAHDHGDKVTGAIDKAGDLVDKKTKGKYASKIDSAQSKAKEAVVKLGETAEVAADPPPAPEATAATPDPAVDTPVDDGPPPPA